jgi:hypothetical protein
VITSAYDIPHDGYWTRAGQVFQFPLVTVFAATRAEADRVAGPEAFDGYWHVNLCIDSAEASSRLGIWGRPDLLAVMMRGDLA